MSYHPVELEGGYYVFGQLQVAAVAQLRDLGVRTVICNRPDDEAVQGETSTEVGECVRAAGMDFHYIPMTLDTLKVATLRSMRALYGTSARPVLGYCRSGARSALLWAAVVEHPVDGLVRRLEESGFTIPDLPKLLVQIRGRLTAGSG